MDKLDHIDGWLCIKNTNTMSSEPIKMTFYWPICRAHAADYPEIGQDVRSYGNGVYSMYYNGRTIQFRLTEGGNTKAIKVIEEKIEPPKTRKGIEIQYRDGRWEKYLKTQGWVAA